MVQVMCLAQPMCCLLVGVSDAPTASLPCHVCCMLMPAAAKHICAIPATCVRCAQQIIVSKVSASNTWLVSQSVSHQVITSVGCRTLHGRPRGASSGRGPTGLGTMSGTQGTSQVQSSSHGVVLTRMQGPSTALRVLSTAMLPAAVLPPASARSHSAATTALEFSQVVFIFDPLLVLGGNTLGVIYP